MIITTYLLGKYKKRIRESGIKGEVNNNFGR